MLTSTATGATHSISVPAPRERARTHPSSALQRGQSAFYSHAGMHGRPWLRRLRCALAEDLFVLHFQPIVALADGRISHYEALLRLADEPHGQLVAPGRFLPAAERYGLIGEIDRMVLGKVAALLAPGKAGADLGGASVAINLSGLSITDEDMLGHLERRLVREGADPERLIIELTETAAITDMDRAARFCAAVQSLGCAVALDDFGAGFGSFQYLKHLPFRYLKIDGDFIRALPGSRTDQLVVKALVAVVAGMGRETIAEFVGDQPTVEMLRSYGVDYAQGFALGRPAPLAALAA